jgi:predicted GNAT superfamily acetyltransferase
MIGPILTSHHVKILQMNREFVHWLSPLDPAGLDYILSRAAYQRQISDGAGVLFGYADDVDYPDHKNLSWLKARFSNFFYIDRIIISSAAQGRGFGRRLYHDAENFARKAGYAALACEINIRPNNPASHNFHLANGFKPIGESNDPARDTAVRYYIKRFCEEL